MTSVSSSVSATNYTAYDALGRVTAANQVTDAQTYSMSYAYNFAGRQTSMTYPSGRVITSGYDEAGRLAGVKDQASGIYYAGAVSTDATNRIQYAPHGAVSMMKLGNGLWEHTNFNNRLQATLIGLGTTSTSSSTMGLTYSYGTTNNNGNVLSVSYAGGGLSYTQNFGYDSLNRLTTSSEGSSWSQTNSYDRYGNRSIVGAALTFNAANNRITTAGYAYDASGNLTNDTIHSYGFDAESKIKTVDGVTGVYSYDGDGNRVRKNFASGEKVRMVYSGGQLIAEYDLTTGVLQKEYVYGVKGLIATIEPTNGTRYTTSDHLGSPRVVTSSSAGVLSRHDYMPFGEEIGVGVGGRTSGMGYGVVDGERQKFTSKERDNETALDYFGARYYGSTQGRFTSPDPYMPSAEVTSPQSWNRYAYCLNNPLKYADPTGLAYSDLDEEQRKLFHTYAAQHNDKGQLTDEQVYGKLDESQQATYEANTNALEHTELHDKKGNDLGRNALSLVKSVNEIVGENRGGETHVRLYVTLTDDALQMLDRSVEFGHNIFDRSSVFGSMFHNDKYSESYRLKGHPSIQVSYDPDHKTDGDIDIDYRVNVEEGHGKHYNSDIRQIGPETDSKGPINNYQRYIDRWPEGLHRWWEQKTRKNGYYEKK